MIVLKTRIAPTQRIQQD